MEIRIGNHWRQKVMGWARDLLIVAAMWCIWLTDIYMPEIEQKVYVRIFLIAIICIVILTREYQDYIAYQLEKELEEIKNKKY